MEGRKTAVGGGRNGFINSRWEGDGRRWKDGPAFRAIKKKRKVMQKISRDPLSDMSITAFLSVVSLFLVTH